MIEERTGIITFQGNPLTLIGKGVSVGEAAPEFCVLANDLTPRTLADYKGKVLVISVVPSLDTPVCDMQTRRFNTEAAKLSDNVRIPDHQLRPALRPDPLVRSRRGRRRRNPLRPPRPFLWYGLWRRHQGTPPPQPRRVRHLRQRRHRLRTDRQGSYPRVDFEAALGAVKACLEK